MFESGPCSSSRDKPAEVGCWYLSRKEIEENSPSRRDGIDLKKEKYLRKSYCSFLQELGIRLYLPQLTIATATVFCHRFFLRQSHAKNDRRTIATVCMFLAGKVEVTPRPLEVLVPVSYAIIHKKDPAAAEKIKLKYVFDQEVKLILLGEKAVLATLGFDFDVHHPYNTLLGAVKKFKASRNEIAQFAWNFINDGLKTSLCLQYKPQQIAAAAIFLAANYLKVKILHDGEKVWWQEFDVTPQQLEEIGNQILELYEQNPMPLSSDSEVEESTMVESSHRTAAGPEESDAESGCSKAPSTVKAAASMPTSFQSVSDHSYFDDQSVPQRSTQSPRSPYGGAEMEAGQWKDEGAQEDEIETVFDRELEEVMHNFNLLNEPEPEYPDHGKDLSDRGSRG